MKILIDSIKSLFNQDNDFFNLAKSGKRITHIAIAIPILIVFLLGGVILGQIIYQLVIQNLDLPDFWIEFYGLGISFGFVILMLWLWVRFFEKRSLLTLGLVKGKILKKYFIGFFSGFLMLSIVIGLMAIFGTIGINQDHEPFKIQFLGVMFVLLLGYVVQGGTEELIARGWQFQVIGARYRPWLGLVISSFIFALLHGMNPGVSILAFINLFLFAILLTIFILYFKSLWAACGWHTAWNWSMENIYGLKVSGTEGKGSILNLTADGPHYLTGGGFGPEGSILTTVVLVSGIIILIWINAKKSNKS